MIMKKVTFSATIRPGARSIPLPRKFQGNLREAEVSVTLKSSELMRESPSKKILNANEQMARYRDIVRLMRGGFDRGYVAERLGVSTSLVEMTWYRYRDVSMDPNVSLRLYLRTNTLHVIADAIPGLRFDTIQLWDMKAIIASGPIWRRWMHCNRRVLEEIEQMCKENGIVIKPGIYEGSLRGMSEDAYDALKAAFEIDRPVLKDLRHHLTVGDGKKRLIEAVPSEELWKDIVDFCGHVGISGIEMSDYKAHN